MLKQNLNFTIERFRKGLKQMIGVTFDGDYFTIERFRKGLKL